MTKTTLAQQCTYCCGFPLSVLKYRPTIKIIERLIRTMMPTTAVQNNSFGLSTCLVQPAAWPAKTWYHLYELLKTLLKT